MNVEMLEANLKELREQMRLSYIQTMTEAVRLIDSHSSRRQISDHLGHNLATHAAHLSVVAGKIAQLDQVLGEISTRKAH